MVNFIKSFGKVDSTDVYGATWINKMINNFTACIGLYSIGTSQAFFKKQTGIKICIYTGFVGNTTAVVSSGIKPPNFIKFH